MSGELHHVSIFVRDMERSLELFSGLLGMEIVQRVPRVKGNRIDRLLGITGFEAEMVFLKHRAQKVCLELVRQTAPAGANPPPAASGQFGLSLVVRKIDHIHAQLRRAGWNPLSEPLEMRDPAGKPKRLFCFHTDEGLMVELIERLA